MLNDKDFHNIGNMSDKQLAEQIELAHTFIICAHIERDLTSPEFDEMRNRIAQIDCTMDAQDEIDFKMALIRFLN